MVLQLYLLGSKSMLPVLPTILMSAWTSCGSWMLALDEIGFMRMGDNDRGEEGIWRDTETGEIKQVTLG